MPRTLVMTHENAMPIRKPASAAQQRQQQRLGHEPLEDLAPEAPIAILTPTSRTRSLSDASWMFTFTIPPPIRAQDAGEHEDEIVDVALAELRLAGALATSSSRKSSCWRWLVFRPATRLLG